ncbi:MAG: hypothetical protein RSC91_10255 [Clostridia bacterium]
MNFDPIVAQRELRRDEKPGLPLYLAMAALFAASLWMFRWEFGFENTDLYLHAMIAHDFNFADLHSITSRLAYPMWHLCVSALYQLGMPLVWASAAICALCKALALLLTQRLLTGATDGKVRQGTLTLVSLALVTLTPLCLPWLNPQVYSGVGSPNVWHNPTQLAVTVAMLLCVPWLMHCWYAFERGLDGGKPVLLPWWKIVVLSALLMLSLACKPTFMQALIPAAFVMYAVELVRHRTQWRYFGQIVLAFLPAVAYFLLQYLYYTGVVVEYTSGVEIGITWESFEYMMRGVLLMSAFPLYAVLLCRKRGILKDRMLVLALWMTLFSVVEGMTFRETGMRLGHGNFTWAANSSSCLLWVAAMGAFLRCFMEDRKNAALTPAWKVGYGVGWALFAWHAVSGVWYVIYLLSTGSAF